jgi:hypothetical protein
MAALRELTGTPRLRNDGAWFGVTVALKNVRCASMPRVR